MNTIGHLFRVTTWGESHGKALGAIVDGCPPGLLLNEQCFENDLKRRKSTKRIEDDKVEILSGVFNGITLGTPISLMVLNKNQKSEDYEKLKNIYRAGHADFSYEAKYGIRDYRGGGRSSGRETIARVLGGVVAKLIIPKIEFETYIKSIGTIENNRLNKNLSQKMLKFIKTLEQENDSCGGIIEMHIKNVPAGLGSPVFGKLEAELAKALMSIGAVKGFEFGLGFNATKLIGSENNLQMSGGISGGISDGSTIVLKIAVKPPSSVKIGGRHDTCLIPRINVVLESMAAIILADQTLIQKTIR